MVALRAALQASDQAAALDATNELLEGGVSAKTILEEGLTEGLLELGRLWTAGEAFLPQVVVAADIFAKCSAVLEPALLGSETDDAKALCVMATVTGDLHDLGKNIVSVMMRTAGLDVHDLGIDVSSADIVEAVRRDRPALLGLSAMLTTTMEAQREVIAALSEAGLRDGVSVIVGGAPVTEEWASQIGADGYAPDAAGAVELARQIALGEPA
jgi:methylmalonyl-CoA mutase cobalamin-binding domain/chain